MKIFRLGLLVLVFSLALAPRLSLAAPDEYDDSQSHPLRVVAYLIYPAAFLLEWTVFRPFHFLVSATEPQEQFFGHTPHPPILAEPQPVQSYGTANKTAVPQTRARPDQPSPPAAGQTVPADR